MTAIGQPTPTTTLNDICDWLDLEIGFVDGLASAIEGLECLDKTRHNGVIALADAHIERLWEISAAISDVVDGVAASAIAPINRRFTISTRRARAA